jgi:isopentenyl diphosphate isomerase/L-lactate dehydrogenase-like FMN-dependent dehydrogenase
VPVLTGPAGQNGMFPRDGEIGVARAVGRAGTIQVVSSVASDPIEQVVAAAAGPVFFQLYFHGGREANEARIERAQNAGCAALVVTVDTATMLRANRNVRRRVTIPCRFKARQFAAFLPEVITRPVWLCDFIRRGMKLETTMLLDSADDARRAVDAGAAAVIASNHGGLLFDARPATVDVLPHVLEAVSGDAEVWVDSGVRSGTDVVKALALCARAVLIGRGYVWARAAAGEAGVERVLGVHRAEVDGTLAALGCASVDELNPSMIWPGARSHPVQHIVRSTAR